MRSPGRERTYEAKVYGGLYAGAPAQFDVVLTKKSPLTLKHFEDFAANLAARSDSDRSWTVDLAALRVPKAAAQALPYREISRAKGARSEPGEGRTSSTQEGEATG